MRLHCYFLYFSRLYIIKLTCSSKLLIARTPSSLLFSIHRIQFQSNRSRMMILWHSKTYLFRSYPEYPRVLSNRSRAPITVLPLEMFAAAGLVKASVGNPRILRCIMVSSLGDRSSNFCLGTIPIPNLIRSVHLSTLQSNGPSSALLIGLGYLASSFHKHPLRSY